MIFDASALLAYLFGEPGGLEARRLIPGAAMATINATEVITKMVKRGATPDQAIEVIESLDLDLLVWDEALMKAAAPLAPLAWTHGLSLGDRACLASAKLTGKPVLTCEHRWKQLPDLGIEIQWIR